MRILIAASVLLLSASAFADEMGLVGALKEAEKVSPQLRHDEQMRTATKDEIQIKKSKYYPNVSVAAIASTGNPGSFSMFDVDSDLSSTNRVGTGGGVVVKQDIWDFGRTSHAVESAHLEHKLSHRQEDLTKMDVDRDVLDTYLECSFLRTQIDNSQFVMQKTKLLSGEISKYVHSGQRSIVELYLLDAEVKNDETRIAEFQERLKVTEQRLGLLLGKNESPVECHKLVDIEGDISHMEARSSVSPLLEFQKIKLAIAESKLSEARSGNYPDIFGMATAGLFDNEHLKDRANYAVGVGISLPLFSGFAIDSSIHQRTALLGAEQASMDVSQEHVAQANSKFDERIRSLGVRLQFLKEEEKHAKKVFDLAKNRYQDLKGGVTDLRDSIKNMSRILLSNDETTRDLLTARGEKSLFNGF